jgi:flagellar biosynthesis/type III secretory pathway chaperone
MMTPLITAGQRLSEALRAENEALAQLDLTRAAALASAKQQATDAFAAAQETLMRLGTRPVGAERERAEALALSLRELGTENRRLLERAITLQARVIETIAGAAAPVSGPGTYGTSGTRSTARVTTPLSLSARA